jgi:DNA modification methylase
VSDPRIQLLIGDCRETLATLPAASVQCCVTSPPYFGLRDYGVAGQIGLERTPDEFVAQLVSVFREVRRVLRDDGTVWLNLGDSYAASGRGGNPPDSPHQKQATNRGSKPAFLHANACESGAIGRTWVKPPEGYKPKDLIGIPWLTAFALRADGWYLRQEIIWAKPAPMPESIRDRCTKSHEQIFLLSKSRRYYFDADAIAEPAEEASADRYKYAFGGAKSEALVAADADGIGQRTRPVGMRKPRQSVVRGGFNGKTNEMPGRESFRAVTETRNKRSVWTVATQPFPGSHFATFPPALIEPCILAGCPEGGTVLDPFGGSGTTAGVALKHGRRAILCELNPAYASMVDARVRSIAEYEFGLFEGAAS